MQEGNTKMLTTRFCIGLVAAALITGPLAAQEVNLTEAPLDGRCVRNEIAMKFAGKITVKQDGKDVTYPHRVEAQHVYVERFMEMGPAIGMKAARQYATAQSTIIFNNNDSTRRTLRAERRFLVTQRVKDRLMTYSPDGPLTREEMELTEHFDTLGVSGLLPGKAVEVGKTWTVSNAVVAALCEFDGLTTHNLVGTLASVKDDIAQIKIAGNASGINLGASVAMIVNAQCTFDVKQKRIVSLEWKESDERKQGPITPALTAEVVIKLTRSPVETPNDLNDFALVKVPTTKIPPAEVTSIRHDDAKKRFSLRYARDWHVVSPEDSAQLVLRHLERGDFIAQATITAWKKTDPKNVMSVADFAALMSKTTGWVEDKETERREFKAEERAKGHHAAYRVVASGELDGVRTVQYFYLVVSPQGEQRIVTFSVVPQHVGRLGARDVELIRELSVP
jgi:hypothetical protein